MTPKAVVSLDVTNRETSELEQEILVLLRRVKKLTALLRLAVALLRGSKFTLANERLPDGGDKRRILRAVGGRRPPGPPGGQPSGGVRDVPGKRRGCVNIATVGHPQPLRPR